MTKFKTQPDHIHTPGDGRGLRKVYVDGVEIKSCFYVDTRRGIVDCHREPLRLDKHRKRILSKRVRGTVTVVNI